MSEISVVEGVISNRCRSAVELFVPFAYLGGHGVTGLLQREGQLSAYGAHGAVGIGHRPLLEVVSILMVGIAEVEGERLSAVLV